MDFDSDDFSIGVGGHRRGGPPTRAEDVLKRLVAALACWIYGTWGAYFFLHDTSRMHDGVIWGSVLLFCAVVFALVTWIHPVRTPRPGEPEVITVVALFFGALAAVISLVLFGLP